MYVARYIRGENETILGESAPFRIVAQKPCPPMLEQQNNSSCVLDVELAGQCTTGNEEERCITACCGYSDEYHGAKSAYRRLMSLKEICLRDIESRSSLSGIHSLPVELRQELFQRFDVHGAMSAEMLLAFLPTGDGDEASLSLEYSPRLLRRGGMLANEIQRRRLVLKELRLNYFLGNDTFLAPFLSGTCGASVTSLDLSGCMELTDATLLDLMRWTNRPALRLLNLSDCVSLTSAGLKELLLWLFAPESVLKVLALSGCPQLQDDLFQGLSPAA